MSALRKHWSLALAAIIVLGLALVSWWGLKPAQVGEVHAQRVLVLVSLEREDGGLDWREDPAASALAAKLARELGALGLDAVLLDGPAARLAARDPLGAARDRQALHLLEVEVHVADRQELAPAGAGAESVVVYVLVVELALIDTASELALAVPGSSIRVVVEAPSPSDALDRIGRGNLDRITTSVAQGLTRADALASLVGSPALEPLFGRARAQDQAEELRERDRERERELERQRDVAELPREVLGDPLGSDRFIGTTARGEVIVLRASKHVRAGDGPGDGAGDTGYRADTTESALITISEDGQRRGTLLQRPPTESGGRWAVSADGRSLWSLTKRGLAILDVLDGSQQPIEIDAVGDLVDLLPAPEGRRALIVRLEGSGKSRTRRCELVDRGSRRVARLPLSWSSRHVFWSLDSRRIYNLVDEQLLALDVEGSGALETVELVADLSGHDIDEISLGHDGSYLFVVEDIIGGPDRVARVNLDGSNYERLASFDSITTIVPSGTDARVAVGSRRYGMPGIEFSREIHVVGPEPGSSVLVSRGAYTETLEGWSRDGRSLFTNDVGSTQSSSDYDVHRVMRYVVAN